ncbi:hypothetical protein A1O3_01205 [Capronia epimyces CBS 606.96]|uniref:F-box domain-containing protein n=1 Tax=Capronia epimyces CBS 606.96 TaxID=1182542 RepID=W9YJC3_9EURO|nr:uncharacterized protein A1O3_01205 [Capronia epimyces CBS 606.96]EXJ92653.1 hypothetical protein A1O3_01205 [Capronia epimyces CBS 606.96]
MESSVAQPRWLLKLPNELKLHIVDYIDERRDLYNLSRTCRVLEDKVATRLYRSIDCDFPRPGGYGKPESVPFRDLVTESVQQLTIRNGPVDIRHSVSRHRLGSSDPASVDGFVNEVLKKVPAGRLTSFAFLHQTPLSPQALDLVFRRHETALQHLSFYELRTSQGNTHIPKNLISLECRTVDEGEGIEKIITENKKTLQRLQLGQERHLMEQYQRTRADGLEQPSQPRDTFFTTALRLEDLTNLRELSLFGLDVSRLRPASIPDALFFCRLNRLTLESCPGSAEFLDSITSTFQWTLRSPDAPQTPRVAPSLEHFLFRHENPVNAVKESVIRFLTSFTGLRTLSLLFENGAILERSSTFIAGHGPTLHTLVLESRIQPREHLGLDTSRPFGAFGYSQELWEGSINDIARLCPNLVELGMGFPWNDELVRLRRTALPTLQHLKTIHIRNFPENHVLSQLGDYSIKEYATKFVEWGFPALMGGSQPALEQLAIGPTLYESRWKMSPPSITTAVKRQPPQFLRSHYFCLDWAKTRFGRWSPLVTPVSEKFVEELAGTRPLGGVFEQVWLR